MKNKKEEQTILDWISDNQGELIALLQDLVRIPSVSGEELAVQKRLHQELEHMDLNPEMFYPNEKELRKHKDFFETTSFVKYGYDDRPNVGGLLRGSGGGRSLCLSGHIDVVSPEPLDQWTRNPWSGDVIEGDLHGRGAGDMKAGVAAMIFAVKAIQANGITLKGDMQVETTIEEEDGGIGGVLYMRIIRPKTDASFVPEPSNHTISLASAGVMYFRVTVPGAPAHAATAHSGVNAIQKMMLIIDEIESLHKDRQSRISYATAESDPRMKGRATTINIGVIKAGDWPSTVPGSCEIECRIGFPPGETREQVMAQVEDAVNKAADGDDWLRKNRPEVTWFGWKARPHELEESNVFVQQVRNSVNQVTGTYPMFTGGSAGLDTRFFVHHGIPAVTCGPMAERIHSFDEIVTIDSTIKTAQVIASTMIEWCGLS
ncbi:MAG: ArgE/DapE family deacylase [Candidatus Thorarchaeota archaeon]|nr:MAG: ArgE/DapE family deacylase [Candidatus Thorarchaeota archaeon]